MRKNTQGFTLIELLIVIAIIGILAAVLIPNLLDARTRAFDTAAQTCLKEVSTAEEVYFIDNDKYAHDAARFTPPGGDDAIGACANTNLKLVSAAGDSRYEYTASHDNGSTLFTVTPQSGVE